MRSFHSIDAYREFIIYSISQLISMPEIALVNDGEIWSGWVPVRLILLTVYVAFLQFSNYITSRFLTWIRAIIGRFLVRFPTFYLRYWQNSFPRSVQLWTSKRRRGVSPADVTSRAISLSRQVKQSIANRRISIWACMHPGLLQTTPLFLLEPSSSKS